MEFESFNEGFLLHIGIAEGESAAVDSLLAIIGDEGKDISGLINGSTTAAAEESPESEESLPEDSTIQPAATILEGVEVVKMPRLSDTMEEGTVASWLKGVGDTVVAAKPLLKSRQIRQPWSLSFMQESCYTLGYKLANQLLLIACLRSLVLVELMLLLFWLQHRVQHS